MALLFRDEKIILPFQGAVSVPTSAAPPRADCNAWGFPSYLPSLEEILEAHRARLEDDLDVPTYSDVLERSRTFASADCAEAMGATLGVSALLNGLRGSLVASTASLDAVAAVRERLRRSVRRSWSRDAVKRGVLRARAGDADGAVACYEEALRIDPDDPDALVARGAALANALDLQKAFEDLSRAADLDPGHANAAKYLKAVIDKAERSGIRLRRPAAVVQKDEGVLGHEGPAAAPGPRPAAEEEKVQGLEDREGGESSSSSGGGSSSTTRKGSSGERRRKTAAKSMDASAALDVLAAYYSKKKTASKEEERKRRRSSRSRSRSPGRKHKHKRATKKRKKRGSGKSR
jgi:tetratricopeptide (TPR) repeat protein